MTFSVLTSEQIEQFQTNGFLVISSFLSSAECSQLKDQAATIVHSFDLTSTLAAFEKSQLSLEEYYLKNKQRICLFFEPSFFQQPDLIKIEKREHFVKKISYALHEDDPVFQAFSNQLRLKTLVTQLGTDLPLAIQSMYLFKPPFIGSEVSCHQDSTFLLTEPDSLIGLWFALDDATQQNGCLWVIPRGHQSPLKARYAKNQEGKLIYSILEEEPWDLESMIPLEVQKGSLIILHGRLPHMSLANHSSNPRQAYSLHWVSQSAHYLESNWLPLQSLY